MLLIDSHTHLFSSKLLPHIQEVMDRAKANHVQKFVLPNIDVESITDMMDLASKYPGVCYPTMGLHPCSVGANVKNDLQVIKEHLISENSFYAVGEIGIDLYWDKTYIEEQKWAFAEQIEWAKELALPIIIHARNSFDEIFDIVDRLNDDKLRGVFHCFTGTLDQAQKIMDYGGFKMGIGGVLTFKKSGLDQVVKNIPLEHLVLETDSPYLAPAPYRGKQNESSYLIYIAKKLAEVKDISLEEVAQVTTKNSMELFRL